MGVCHVYRAQCMDEHPLPGGSDRLTLGLSLPTTPGAAWVRSAHIQLGFPILVHLS